MDESPDGEPTRVCPSCSTQTVTSGQFCPHCGTNYKEFTYSWGRGSA
jgi:hypothetical protein